MRVKSKHGYNPMCGAFIGPRSQRSPPSDRSQLHSQSSLHLYFTTADYYSLPSTKMGSTISSGKAIPLRFLARDLNLETSQTVFVGPNLAPEARERFNADCNFFNVGLMKLPFDFPEQREHEERERTHVLDRFLDARDCEGVNILIRIRRNRRSAAAAKPQRRRNRKLPLRGSGRFHFIAPLGRDSPRLAPGGFGESARRSRVDMAAGVRFFDNRRPVSADEVHARGGA
ncbi:hypothetical protein SO802_033940 [Lithocarpus litseifolius]|uniref:Uncharacterized protein n=1 Tax=Lithocarpus litseifolius TaxID=425828 RepID=A0AAW2BHR0_9ROSI